MDDVGCAACGAETLLFECPRCGGAYCADHELPHHACDGFGDSAADERDELLAAGFEPLVDGAESGGATAAVTDVPVETPEPVPVGADERDAARETRPDSERRWPVPDVRGLPHERQESLDEWFRRQSLVGYALKVGLLALLFNAAYFAGLAATLYGFV